MMEDHEFCDSCDGCRPAILNIKTGKPLSREDPVMVAVDKMWDEETTFAQRRAYIEVTLKNSRQPRDMELAMEVFGMIKNKMKEMDGA
jgi:hypothetical protein